MKEKQTKAMTRMQTLTSKLRAAGLVQVAVWCSPETAEKFKAAAARDRAAARIKSTE